LRNKVYVVASFALAALLLAWHAASAAPRSIGAAPSQHVDFVLKLPLRNTAELDALIHAQSSAASPLYHHFLSAAQFRTSFGPTAVTFAKAEAALRSLGLTITGVESQMLLVRGNAAMVGSAFHTRMGIARGSSNHPRIAARTPVVLPEALRALGATVANLSASVRPRPLSIRSAAPLNRDSSTGSYWFDDLKEAYDYPAYSVASGAGVTIATVGYADFSTSDADAYFAHEKLGHGGLAPAPLLEHKKYPGALPFDIDNCCSGEANLDVQQAGGSAPGATVIGVSVDPNQEFLNAYADIDDNDYADIVSTSYGDCELYESAAYPFNDGIDYADLYRAYHDLFRQGNSQGITFVFASGDNAGTQCAPPAYFGPATGATYGLLAHGAGYWVNDPDVTGVGGTNVITSHVAGSLASTYVSQNAVSDRVTVPFDLYGTGNYLSGVLWGSAGGPSSFFAKPAFQKLVATGYDTRTVPDVAMHMGGCPIYGVPLTCGTGRDSSDVVVAAGALYPAVGTSAAAPEFAGLLAVKESLIKSRLGNENEDIYRLAADNANGHYFKQGIYGYNGVVHARQGQLGYNPIVGVGTPIANNFLGLTDAALAADPQTASNP
jgi:subtilase family serine protease